MSEYLQICRGGTIKLFRQDNELIAKYRQKRKGDQFLIIDKETKQTIKSFPNLESAENFFYKESPINNIFTHFRSNFYLEVDVTLGDVRKALESIEELEDIIKIWFPFFPSIAGGDSALAPAEELIVSREGKIEDGIFSVETNLGFTNTRHWTEETKISLDTHFLLACPYGEKKEFISNYTLLGFLCSLYEFAPNPPVTLTPFGVFDENQKLIDAPFGVLLSPCTISDDLTLNDIFNLVSSDELLESFLQSYSWCKDIEKFHEQAKLSPIKKNDCEDLWFIEVFCSERFYEALSSRYLQLTPEIHALGELSPETRKHYEEHPEVPMPNHQSYSISYSPVNNLKHLGIKLSGLKIYEISKDYKHSDVIEAQYNYTLLEILDAIYWDISFVGGPEDKEEFLDTMRERVESIRNEDFEIEPLTFEENEENEEN